MVIWLVLELELALDPGSHFTIWGDPGNPGQRAISQAPVGPLPSWGFFVSGGGVEGHANRVRDGNPRM